METQTTREKKKNLARRGIEGWKQRDMQRQTGIVYCNRQQRESVTLTPTVLSRPGDFPPLTLILPHLEERVTVFTYMC